MGIGPVLGRKIVERGEEIDPHLRIGVLLYRERRRGVANEDRKETVLGRDRAQPPK